MPENIPPISRRRVAGVMARLAWAADRRRSVFALALYMSQTLAESLFALWLKLLLDSIADHNATTTGVATAGIVGSIAGGAALSYGANRVQGALRDRVGHLIAVRTLKLVGHTPTLELHETPAHITQLETLRQEGFQLSQVIPRLTGLLAAAIRIGITAVLLASVHPLLLLLPIFGVPGLLLSPKTSGLFRRGNELAAEPARRAQHIIELTATAGGAKEVQLFRLGAELLARFHANHREIRAIHWNLQVNAALLGLVARLSFLIGYFGAIVFTVQLAISGRASLGDAALVAVLAGQVLGLVTDAAESLQLTMQSVVAASRFIYIDDVASRALARIDRTAAIPDRISYGIELRNVSYRYPRATSDALHDVSLLLPAGGTVAIVGDNGAGKSTLVKLLAGMYLPTAGAIRIDDADLGRIDPEQWRLRITAAFQDHARFEFLVRETIGIGDLTNSDDDAIFAALDRAGAADLATAFPDGLDTQLGPSWERGVDLSGGQWQKLALARAMMRTEPLLLLLDEPTAALDADTENRLFEYWARASARARQKTGAITVLVSHRFSTVRMADLIVVVSGGVIAESGSHAELIARNGLYAELFELQARSYR